MSSTSILAYFILAASVVYVFVYPPYQEISILMGEKEKYDEYLAMAMNVDAKTSQLLTKFNQITPEEKKNIDTVLPDSYNFVRLVSQIDNIAGQYGIKIDRITSRDVSSSVGDSIAEAGPDKQYKSAVIGFSFTATYEKFNEFMAALEKSLRILDIRSVRINTATTGLYTYSVEFEVYWLKI